MNGLAAVSELLDRGGNVLWFILLLSIYLWNLIFERLIFLKFIYPDLLRNWLKHWHIQSPHYDAKETSFIRKQLLSEAKISMETSLTLIKMLIAICPMLGLLGTVLGMIHVFDVMAVTGNSNVRATALGISQATISTMAGMIVAISGLYFQQVIRKNIDDNIHQLNVLLK